MSTPSNSQVHAWLHRPITARRFVLASSKHKQAVSGASFIGTADPQPNPDEVADIYRKPEHLSTAVSTISDRCAKNADWSPSEDDTSTLAVRFDDYIKELTQNCPFFSVGRYQTVAYDMESTSVEQLVSNMINLYKGFETDDIKEIEDSINGLVETVLNTTKTTESTTLVENTIDTSNPDNVRFLIGYVYIMLTEVDGKVENLTHQEVTGGVGELIVHRDLIAAFAEKLAKLESLDVETWLDKETTPNPGSKVPCWKTR